jgi:hypothetical protein
MKPRLSVIFTNNVYPPRALSFLREKNSTPTKATTASIMPLSIMMMSTVFGSNHSRWQHVLFPSINSTRCDERPVPTEMTFNDDDDTTTTDRHTNEFRPLLEHDNRTTTTLANPSEVPLEYATKKSCFSCMVVSVITSSVFAAYFANMAIQFPAIMAQRKNKWKPQNVVWGQRFMFFTSALWIFGAIHNVMTF